MERRYEFVDLIVAIGLFATIVAGGLLFMAANGTLSLSSSRQSERVEPIGTSNGMRWLQPVLGQAILDHLLLERNHEKSASAVIAQLDRLTLKQNRWQNSPFGYLDSISRLSARAEVDHDTRVQAVMGLSIVQFTGRGVLSGVLSSGENDSPYNSRMIGSTETMGRQMDTQFLANWQPNLGRAIVIASLDGAAASARMQERLGAAIMQLTSVQTHYDTAHGAIQQQLGGATIVATRTQSQMSGMGFDRPVQSLLVAVATPRSWPALPMATIVVASLILMSLLTAGLLVSPSRPVGSPG
jgi:hypothetical protein